MLRYTVTGTRRMFVVALVLCVTLGAIGCGGDATAKQYSVSGSVTLDGTPVADGQIKYIDAKSGKSFVGAIKDGKYDLKAEVGEMKVEIVASRPVPGKFDTTTNPGVQEPVVEMYIPRQYNSETTLLKNVEATSNSIPFELTSGKPGAGKK